MNTANDTIFENPAIEQDFRKKGFVLTPLLNATEVGELSRRINSLNSNHQNISKSALNPDMEYRRNIHRVIVEIMGDRINKLLKRYRIALGWSVLKQPGRQSAVPIHQDSSVGEREDYTSLSVWCPLEDVNEKNGCMRLWPGSHNIARHLSGVPKNPAPWDGVTEVIERELMTSVPLAKGDAMIFDSRLLHCSTANMSRRNRTAINTWMLPEDVIARFYSHNKAQPNKLKIFDARDDLYLQLDLTKPLPYPYPDGLNEVGTVEIEAKSWTLEYLKVQKSSLMPLRRGDLTVPGAPRKKYAWFSDFFAN